MLIYSIEDDKDIALIINKTLTKQGFEVNTFYNGKSFLDNFKIKKPDIILLDLMLPDMSGIDILKKIRMNNANENIHIIIISAKHMVTDKVEGLDFGADDYIEKPFDLLELMSRVEAHARRLRKKEISQYGDFRIDLNKRECIYKNREIELTNKEFDILVLLLDNSTKVLSRNEIFEKIWETDQVLESRSLDMHIKTLREKLNDNGRIIKSVYGIGYKINI